MKTAETQRGEQWVLVVDDDEGLRELIICTLARCGFAARGAARGSEAVELTATTPPALMLLDYRLPDMTGQALASALAERGSAVPFVMMTGQGDERLAVELMKLGAADYLVKDTELVDRLPAVVERTLRESAVKARLRMAEEALRESEERLRQAEKLESIGRLAGGIAHDFNNQLGGILGYAELLELKLADPALRRYAEAIRTTALRAADLTQQMLAFARKGKHLTVPVDLHAVVRETAAILERSIDKRIEIRLRLEAATSVVTGDPTQLQNAVLNLSVNARDAMPQGGELVFATAVETLADALPAEELTAGRYLVLSVTDSGIGMDAATQKRIFEPFFTTKEVGKGTGLGLASVYGTVKNHGGVIRVTSEPGHGSTFRIHLPLSAEGAVPAAATAAVLTHGQGRILLVDDEAVICDIGRELLTDLGYTVTACGDPNEALALYRREWQAIDLVILDMVMPKLGAKDLFLALREINPRVRALLASGYAVNGETQGILDAGVLGFVQKPFGQATLARAVAEAMKVRLSR